MERKPYKNSVENQKYIILALAEIMKIKPFHEVSVTEVCKKAGVSKNTFYRHFENLSDVIYQCIGEINSRLIEAIYSMKNHGINNLLLLICHSWYENREFLKPFAQEETIYIIYSFNKKNTNVFYNKIGIENPDDALLSDFFATVFCMFLKWWCNQDFAESPEEIAKHIEDCLCGRAFEKFLLML